MVRHAATSDLPHCICWDWMHNGVASSGVAQYEVSQLIRRLARLVPLQTFDEFKKLIVIPHC